VPLPNYGFCSIKQVFYVKPPGRIVRKCIAYNVFNNLYAGDIALRSQVNDASKVRGNVQERG